MATTYPFDSTGLLPSNKILNESQTPVNANGIDPYLIIPNATPFYGESTTVVNDVGDVLIEGVDYYLAYHWPLASSHVGKEIYGGIVLTAAISIGTVKLTYQTIGGDYVDNRANAVTEGTVSLGTVLALDWDNAPTSFPTTPHTHTLDSLTGMTEILQALNDIELALGQPLQTINFDDITDLDINFVDPLMTKLGELVTAVNNRDAGVLAYGAIIAELNVKIAEYDAIKTEVLDASAAATIVANNAIAIANANGVLPLQSLKYPTIGTLTNEMPVTPLAATNGGTLTVPADIILSIGEEIAAGLTGKYLTFTTIVFTSVDLDINSTYFLRMKIVGSVLLLYTQKGIEGDLIPLSLLGVENAISGGGFESTVLDARLALITTGAATTIPVIQLYPNIWFQPNKIPSGFIIFTLGDIVSPGFIKINNSELNRAQFSGIYNYALNCSNFVSQAVKDGDPLTYKGYFGDGDGTTTFTLPDSRGEFPRFWDDGLGVDVGRIIGSHQLDDFKSHRHSHNRDTNNDQGGDFQGRGPLNGPGDYNTGFTGGVETRPRSIAYMALIKI